MHVEDGMARLLRNSRMFQLCRIIRAYRIFLLVLLLPGGARSDLGRIQELMQGMSTGAKHSRENTSPGAKDTGHMRSEVQCRRLMTD